MAKRFSDTEIWKEDWYLIMPAPYKLLWKFITDTCDHAGIWRPNLVHFEAFNGKIDLQKGVEYFNQDKDRIIALDNGRYLLPDFFAFQYGEVMNLNNRLHLSVFEILNKNEVNLRLIRGLKEVKDRSSGGLIEVKVGVKDKEKDIIKEDINTTNKKNINRGKFEKPEVGQVENYFLERGLSVNLAKKESQSFVDHYTSKNWFVGKNKMVDWKAAVRNWIRRMEEKGIIKPTPSHERSMTEQEVGNLFGGLKNAG